MHRETTTPQKPSLWHRFLAFKTLLVSFSLVGLLASNVASLVSASAHDWMHNALWRVMSIGGQAVADRALANSPKAKLEDTVKKRTAELAAKNRLQAKELEDVQVKNLKLAQQVDVNGKQAKATAAAVHQRLAKGVSRNVAALPSESIPYLGLGVTLAVTSLDIYDACQTMKDFNALLRMMGQGEEKPDLCGQKVPTVDQVLASAKAEWRSSVQRVTDDAKAFKVAVPNVRLPTRDEMAKASCAAVAVPYLCPEK
ncbi:hypothetical protein [Limnohabitans sp. 2KL-3]|uniref:hypothetical protein n=1 Tax=Limnohabitans sp. 2KL-3 TaxID=1100700 RepID=UPI000A96D27B|nr:hypothetical protein [Limnohabitans sp. 2KL-3]